MEKKEIKIAYDFKKFMIFIWLVGWLFTVGMTPETVIESANNSNIFSCIAMYVIYLLAWPYWLGIIIAGRYLK